MSFNHFMGVVRPGLGLRLDPLLLFLLIPFGLVLASLVLVRKPVHVLGRRVKLGVPAASVMILAFVALFFAQSCVQLFSDEKSFSFFSSVDVIIGGIFASLVLMRRLGIARTFIPAIIILAGANILNKQGQTFDMLNMVIDLLLICLSALIGFSTNQVFSIKSFAFASVTTSVFIGYALYVNGMMGTWKFIFPKSVDLNVYKWIFDEISTFMSLVFISLIFQISLWVMARVLFTILREGSLKQALLRKATEEWKKEMIESLEEVDEEMAADFWWLANEPAEEGTELVAEKIVYKQELLIVPQSIRDVFNAQGARAPTFFQ